MHAIDFLANGQEIPGIMLAPWDAQIGLIIADLLLITDCSEQHEWDGKVFYLPL